MKCQTHIRYQWFFLSCFLFIRLSCAYFDQNITLAVVFYAVVRINRLNLLYINVMHVEKRCATSELLVAMENCGRCWTFFLHMTVSQVECSEQRAHSHPIHTNNNNLMIRLL